MTEIELKERQSIALEILVEFDKFCHEHKLRYVIEFGTLLGAIRHHGFIPWDDDVDVTMPRKDYNRLLKYQSIGEHYLVDDFNDQREHDTNFIKIYDDRTYSINRNGDIRCGIYIDIYPMDYVPDNKIKLLIKMVRLSYLYSATKFAEKPTRIAHNKFLQLIYNIMSHFYQNKGRAYYAKKLNQCAADTKCGTYMSVVIEPDRMFKRMISSEAYQKVQRVPFENYYFDIVEDYDVRLRLEYGNYMKLPPEGERQGHINYKFHYKEHS